MPPADTDALLQNLASTKLCTYEIVAELHGLLGVSGRSCPREVSNGKQKPANAVRPASTSRTRAATIGAKAASHTRGKTTDKAKRNVTPTSPQPLSSGEKIKLASKAFNVALKTLADALSNKTSQQKPLRNASPNKSKSKTTVAATASKAVLLNELHRAKPIAACACTAINYLISSRSSKTTDLKLENGVIALVGQLLGHGFLDLASEELSVLHRCLDRKTMPDLQDPTSLLDFGTVDLSSTAAILILLNYETLVFRLFLQDIGHANLDALSKCLNLGCEWCPGNVLKQLSGASPSSNGPSNPSKGISQVMHHLASALIKVDPLLAVKTESVALRIRSTAYLPAKEAARDVEIECRSLEAFVVRLNQQRSSLSESIASQIATLVDLIRGMAGPMNADRDTDPLYEPLYRSVSDLYSSCGRPKEAQEWIRKAQNAMSSYELPPLKLCGIAVKEAVLALQSALNADGNVELGFSLKRVSDVPSDKLSGSLSDFNVALKEVMSLRKAIYDILRSSPDSQWLTQHRRAELYDVLGFCVNFLSKFLGSRPTVSSDEETLTQYQAKLDIACPLARTQIETTLFAAKKAEASDAHELQALGRMLSASASILSYLSASSDAMHEAKLLDSETKEKLAVGLSNVYWMLSTKARSSLEPDDVVGLMRSSCHVLAAQSLSVQRLGNLPLKWYQTARYLSASELKCDQIKAFEEAVRACLQCGLPKLRDMSRTSAHGSPSTEDVQLQQIYVASLRSVMSGAMGDDAATGALFDDVSLDIQSRYTLMEAQLDLAQSDRTVRLLNSTVACRQVLALLTEKEQNLTQRIRLLSKLLRATESSDDAIWTEVYGAARTLLDINIEDLTPQEMISALALLHLQATLAVSIGLHNPSGPRVFFDLALEKWKTLYATEDLNTLIEDANDWMSQAEIVEGYYGMQGLDNQRLTTLCILERVQGLLEPDPPKTVFARRLDIAQLLDRMGFSEKAEQYLTPIRKELTSADSNLANRARFACVDACCSMALQRPMLSSRCKEELEGLLVLCEERLPGSGRNAQLWLSAADVCQALYTLASSRGKTAEALHFARKRLTFLQRLWRHTTEEARSGGQDLNTGETNGPASHQYQGPKLWSIAPRIVAALLQAASASRDFGYFHDAQALIDQASRIASGSSSDFLRSQALTEKGDFACRSGDLTTAEQHFTEVMAIANSMSASRQLACFNESLGYSNQLSRKWSGVQVAYDRAAGILRDLMQPGFVADLVMTNSSVDTIRDAMRSLALTESRPSGKSRKAKLTSTHINGHVKAKSSEIGTAAGKDTIRQMMQLEEDLARRRADSLLAQYDTVEASKLLNQLSMSSLESELKVLAEATWCNCLLQQASASMAQSTIYSMLSESALSLPALRELEVDLRFPARPGPKSKSNNQSEIRREKARPVALDFAKPLEESLARLTAFQATIPYSFSNFTTSRITSLVTTAAILQRSCYQINDSVTPSQVAWYIELSRNVASARECDAIVVDNAVKGQAAKSEGKPELLSEKPCLLHQNFQADFVDIIPSNWSVISMTLSDDASHLYIVQYKSEANPFILRLPLLRSHSEESEEEGLSFEEAIHEIESIIAKSDETIERAKGGNVDMSSKPEKTKWWGERESLDERIQNLLINIESLWLGGFRGVFSSKRGDETAMRRFEKTLNSILDLHLPSRSQRKATNSRGLELDSKIFELFTGLEDPSDEEVDLEEPLTDLLYFVVDILQFSGEHNAYDEIDFDAMIVETQDALKTYHAESSADSNAMDHLILVLDKRLHGLPWECLPCLEGRPVSRVPSLLDLRTRILLMRSAEAPGGTTEGTDGIRLSGKMGTYMLNPSSDLSKTQTRFETPLSSSPAVSTWSAIVGRCPSEQEFTTALTWPTAATDPPPVLLYIGHGSGCQYVRSKAIRRLSPRCGAALLFGCSSVALRTAGEFEPVGVPKHYMVAGAPAVLGALWDVTDGDCDTFAAGVLRRWGVLGKDVKIDGGRKKKKKTKDRRDEGSQGKTTGGGGKMALDEAVAASRDECYLKYLNGAAMVVYGVPCYLGD